MINVKLIVKQAELTASLIIIIQLEELSSAWGLKLGFQEIKTILISTT